MTVNLLKTPFLRGMVVKCTYNGITLLKNGTSESGEFTPGRFSKRFGGSASHVVTEEGILCKKPKPVKLLDYGRSAKDENNDQEEKKKIEYKVNKKLIRNRVYAYLLGQQKAILLGLVVTFPPCVSDKIAYRALNTWLTVCRQSLHLRDYLWVAERQQNGTIHYHILIPQYFNVEKANKAMAVTLANLCRKRVLNWHVKAAKRYNGVHLMKDDKTLKVINFARTEKAKALSNYITKYITKNDEAYSHYAWHCSRGFSAVFTSVTLTSAEAQYLQLRSMINKERTFENEYAIFIAWYKTPDFFNQLLRVINYAVLNRPPDIEGNIPLYIQN